MSSSIGSDDEQLSGQDDSHYLLDQLSEAAQDLQTPFKVRFQSLLQTEDLDHHQSLAEAFDSVSDLEESFKKILDMASHVVNKNASLEKEASAQSLKNSVLQSQNNTLSQSQKLDSMEVQQSLRAAQAHNEELLQQVEELKGEAQDRNNKVEELKQHLALSKSQHSQEKTSAHAAVNRRDESEELKRLHLELTDKKQKIKDLEITLQENASERLELIDKVSILTTDYAQSKQAAKKFEDRMNRYIKKEEHARKSIEEIARTLQQLNQYNAVLAAENDRLKLEDRRRMDAMVGRGSHLNETRKSLRTSLDESFNQDVRRSTIKDKAQQPVSQVQKHSSAAVVDLQPSHLAAPTDWEDHREEYSQSRQRRKSFQQTQSWAIERHLLAEKAAQESPRVPLDGQAQTARDRVIAEVCQTSWAKIDIQGKQITEQVPIVLQSIKEHDATLAALVDSKQAARKLSQSLTQVETLQQFSSSVNGFMQQLYDSKQDDLICDKLKSQKKSRSKSINYQTVFCKELINQQKDQKNEESTPATRAENFHAFFQGNESKAQQQSRVEYSDSRADSRILQQESYVSNALGNDIGDFGDFFVDQNQMRFQVGEDGQVRQQDASYVSNSGVFQRGATGDIQFEAMYDYEPSRDRNSFQQSRDGFMPQASAIPCQSEASSYKEQFLQSETMEQRLLSFCDGMAKSGQAPLQVETDERVTERNENSEESPNQAAFSPDHFDMSRVDSQHQQILNESLSRINTMERQRSGSQKKMQDLTFANSGASPQENSVVLPSGQKMPSLNISTLDGSGGRKQEQLTFHNQSPEMIFEDRNSQAQEQPLRVKRPGNQFTIQTEEDAPLNPFDKAPHASFGAGSGPLFESQRASSKLQDALVVDSTNYSTARYYATNEKDNLQPGGLLRPETHVGAFGAQTQGAPSPRGYVQVSLEDFEGSEDPHNFRHDGMTEVGGAETRQQKSKRVRESKTVIGFSQDSQDVRSRYVSEFGGGGPPSNINTRKSVALTNHTAMTASRMPVVRKDPNEEFFKMTLLAYKLNNAKNAALLKLSPMDMFTEVKRAGLPFHKWAEWIEQYCLRGLQERRENKKRVNELYKKKLLECIGTLDQGRSKPKLINQKKNK